MTKAVWLPFTVELRQYTTELALRIAFEREGMTELGLGLTLMWAQLVEAIVLLDPRRPQKLRFQIAESSTRTRVLSHDDGEESVVQFSRDDFVELLGMVLIYFRDGAPPGYHMDIEAQRGEDAASEIGIVLVFPEFRPPVSAAEAKCHLGLP